MLPGKRATPTRSKRAGLCALFRCHGTFQKTVRLAASSGEDYHNLGCSTGFVWATGFSSKESLSWLDPTVLSLLDYDESCTRLPLNVHSFATFNAKVPEIAFVGFYEGPYWGVIEAQARLVTNTWLGDSLSSTSAEVASEMEANPDTPKGNEGA